MAYNFSNISVLIVNDVASTRRIMSTALKMNQVKEVYEASDGNMGLSLFKQHQPDVIITELDMNPTDGDWMAKKIRNIDVMSLNRSTPIILITNNSESLSIPNIRDSGFDELLMVPFSVESIAERVAFVLNNPREFVESGDYAGPDRRRKDLVEFEGPYQRDSDPADKKVAIEQQPEAKPSVAENIAEQAMKKWPPEGESNEMLDTLFGYYIQHHEIVLKKLFLAKQATLNASSDGQEDLWQDVIDLFSASGMSDEEMSKIEDIIHALPQEIAGHFSTLSDSDKELKDLEMNLDQEGYKKAREAASELQGRVNPLSGMSPQEYKKQAEEKLEEEPPKVEAFKFMPTAGKFKY